MRTFIKNLVTALTTIAMVVVMSGGVAVSQALAQGFNSEINYQGKLTDSNGSTVADGDYDITFRLYTTSSGGSPIWTETRTASSSNPQVSVSGGLFSVRLGRYSSLSSVDFNQDLWLSLEVEGDGEMTPRKKLTSVPSAIEAENAQNLGGVASSSLLRSDQPDDMQATSSQTLIEVIQDGAGEIARFVQDNTIGLIVDEDGDTGVGTTSTPAQLTVQGSGSDNIQEWFNSSGDSVGVIDDQGNVGIGTTTPSSELQLDADNPELRLSTNATDGTSTIWFDEHGGGQSGGQMGIQHSDSANTLSITDGGGIKHLTVERGSGNVGIGTTSPAQTLTVADTNNFGVRWGDSDGGEWWEWNTDQSDSGEFNLQGKSTGNLITADKAGGVGVGGVNPNNSNTLDVSGAQVIGSSYAGSNSAPSNGLLVEGSTGIGTTSPVSALAVSGTTTADAISVNSDEISDFTGNNLSVDSSGVLNAATGGSGEANTASNIGTGVGIFAQKNGVDLEFKSLTAGSNISLSTTTDEVTVTATDNQRSEDDVEGYIFDADNTGTLSSGTLALDSLSYTGTLGDSQIDDVDTLSTGLTSGSVVFSDGSTLAEDSANFFWDNSNNRLGIGTNSPDSPLFVDHGTVTAASGGPFYTMENQQTVNPSSNSSELYYGLNNYIEGDGSNNIGRLSGLTNQVYQFGSGSVSQLYGSDTFAWNMSGSSITDLIGDEIIVESDTGSVTNLTGSRLTGYAVGDTVENFTGLHVDDLDSDYSGSTVTNRYGIKIDSFTGSATNDYGVYQTGSLQSNYFAGNLGIGTTSPTDTLSVSGTSHVTSTTTLATNGGNVGIGTTSPYAKLSVAGTSSAERFEATATSATSTFAGGIDVDNGALTHNVQSGQTDIDNLELGATTFGADAGSISWTDLPVTASSSAGVTQAYTAQIDGNPLLTVFSEADGSGGIQSKAIGIGTSSPASTDNASTTLAVNGNFYVSGDGVGTSTITDNLRVEQNLAVGTSSLMLDNNSITNTSGDLLLQPNANNNLGIGTTSPVSQLAVSGTTTSQGLNITSGGIEFADGTTQTTAASGGGSPGGSDGQVQFNNSGSFGGSSDFFWDNSNSRLGIGTTSPVSQLAVSGTTTTTGLNVSDNATVDGNLTIDSLLYYSAGNEGSIPFISNSNGQIGQDNSNFYWNAANSRLGIGTSTPSNRLQTEGTADITGTTTLATGNGRVGIGDTTPDNKLEVVGSSGIKARADGGSKFTLRHWLQPVGGSDIGRLEFTGFDTTGVSTGATIEAYAEQNWGSNDAPTSLRLSTTPSGSGSPNERVRITPSGNVGIGTTSPATQLATAGLLTVGGTGTSTFESDIDIDGSIVPRSDNTYTLGTSNLQWRDVYIGPGSLYVNGQKVLQESSSNIIVSADKDQTLQLQTSGTGDVNLNPTGTGQIQMKGDVEFSSGVSIDSSDSSAVDFTSGVTGGNLKLSGNTLSATNTNGNIEIAPDGTGNTYVSSGNLGVGTTTPSTRLDVVGTTTADALAVGGNEISDFTGNNLSVSNGTLNASGGGGSPAGSDGQIQFNSSGSFGASSDLFWDSGNSRLGIGTSSVDTRLDVAGDIDLNENQIRFRDSQSGNYHYLEEVQGGKKLKIGNTFGGTNPYVTWDNNGQFQFNDDGTQGQIDTMFSFNNDPGPVTFYNFDVTSNSAQGNEHSYDFSIDGTELLTMYAESDGSGGIQNDRIGIGTTSPTSALAVSGTATFDGAANIVNNNSLVFGDRIIIGSTSTQASASRTLALGKGAVADNADSVIIGRSAGQTGDDAAVVGASATAGQDSVAFGDQADASGGNAVAVGQKSTADQLSAVAIGRTSKAQGSKTVAIGDTAQASADGGFAMGFTASASGQNAVAVGRNTLASGNDSIAFGEGAEATATSSVAIGQGATSSVANTVVLGNNHDIGIGTTSPVSKLAVSGTTTADALSVGSDAISNFTGNNLSVSNGTLNASGGSGSPGGSDGQVQFNSSGSFAGSSNFFWDDTNNRLGIGTSSPTETLSVNGTTTLSGGDVNIGGGAFKYDQSRGNPVMGGNDLEVTEGFRIFSYAGPVGNDPMGGIVFNGSGGNRKLTFSIENENGDSAFTFQTGGGSTHGVTKFDRFDTGNDIDFQDGIDVVGTTTAGAFSTGSSEITSFTGNNLSVDSSGVLNASGGSSVNNQTYTGSFVISATGSQTISGLPFNPNRVEFRAEAPVNTEDNDDSSSGGDSTDNYAGTMFGFARDDGGSITQKAIQSGGSGNSINNIGHNATTTDAIDIRYAGQNGGEVGRVTSEVSSFNSDGFTLNNEALNLDDTTGGLVVHYTAYRSEDIAGTATDVSDDGSNVLSSVGDINFGSNLSVTDDGDGTATVDASGGGGGSPAGSSGQLQFNDGGSFGATSSLFYSTSSDSLGIGTNSPDSGTALDVEGGRLQIAGDLDSSSDWTLRTRGVAMMKFFNGGSPYTELRNNMALNSNWLSGDGDAEGLQIDSSGNVGVGTSSPVSKLAVSGTTTADAISVNNDEISDFTGTNLSVDSNGILNAASGSGSPGGSDGQVQFNNSGAFDGSSNFFWDSSNNRLGIGTSSPESTLAVSGTTTLSGALVSGSSGLGTNADNTSVVLGESSSVDYGTHGATAIGYWSTADGSYGATAIGDNAWAQGENAIAIGEYVEGSQGASNAITIGEGVGSGNDKLVNDVSHSLIVGFESTKPQLFVDTNTVGVGGATSSSASLAVSGTTTADALSVGGDTITDFTGNNLSVSNGTLNASGGGSGSPGGSDGQVQFNSSGSFGGSSNFFWDNSNNRLGIGTSSPNRTLEVAGDVVANPSGDNSNDFLFGSDQTDSSFSHDDASRMFFDTSKAAFRAGYAYSQTWDSSNIGDQSAAFGISTTASGRSSFAAGDATTASGFYSTAFGYDTLASGQAATALGSGVWATGDYSTAFGEGIEASGSHSFAVALDSNQTNTTVPTSTAAFMGGQVGIGTTSPASKLAVSGTTTLSGPFVSGPNSSISWGAFAVELAVGEGGGAVGGGGVAALGNYSTASGERGAMSLGTYTAASGNDGAVALGHVTTASGNSGATAIGNYIEASGDSSVGIGLDSTSYTVSDNNTMSIMGGNVGIGTISPTSRFDVVDSGGSLLRADAGSGAVLVGDGSTAQAVSENLLVYNSGVAAQGAYNNLSSQRSIKQDFQSKRVLSGISELDLLEWEYASSTPVRENDSSRHMYPFAGDFHNTFGLGQGTSSITAFDIAGVSLRGVQERESILDIDQAPTGTPSITVTANSNVGIGTTSPNYDLQVGGDVAAESFVNVSTKEAKKGVEPLSTSTRKELAKKMMEIDLQRYEYKGENSGGVGGKRLGLIAEEAPADILSDSGKGVDLYEMTSATLASLQETSATVDQLRSQVNQLTTSSSDVTDPEDSSGYTGSSTSDTSASSSATSSESVIASVTGWLSDQAVSIKDGVVEAAKGVFDTVETDQLVIDNSDTSTSTSASSTNRSAGSGLIPTDATSSTITNDRVATTSQVIVTFTDKKLGSHWVEKSDQEFTVNTSKAQEATTTFDYLVVGVKEESDEMASSTATTTDVAGTSTDDSSSLDLGPMIDPNTYGTPPSEQDDGGTTRPESRSDDTSSSTDETDSGTATTTDDTASSTDETTDTASSTDSTTDDTTSTTTDQAASSTDETASSTDSTASSTDETASSTSSTTDSTSGSDDDQTGSSTESN